MNALVGTKMGSTNVRRKCFRMSPHTTTFCILCPFAPSPDSNPTSLCFLCPFAPSTGSNPAALCFFCPFALSPGSNPAALCFFCPFAPSPGSNPAALCFFCPFAPSPGSNPAARSRLPMTSFKFCLIRLLYLQRNHLEGMGNEWGPHHRDRHVREALEPLFHPSTTTAGVK